MRSTMTIGKIGPVLNFAEHELKGIPIRLGIGKRDLEKSQVELVRRDTREKMFVSIDSVSDKISQLLEQMQFGLLEKARSFRDSHITEANSLDSLKEILEDKGGFVSAHWDGTTESELKLKELAKATIRCIPLDNKHEKGTCVISGQASDGRVLIAKAY